MQPPSTYPARTQTGFSLIEVVMAIGILSFVCIPLLGLMPAGLDLFRSSSDETALTLIRSQLVAELRSTGFKNLQEQPSLFGYRAYTKSGEPAQNSGIYTVTLKEVNPTSLSELRLSRMNFEVQKNGVPLTKLAISIPDDGT